MTLVEKIMVILACLMPVIALIIFLPKVIKAKQKKGKQLPTQPYVVESQPVESKPQIVQPEKPKLSSHAHANEFADYAANKSRRMARPKANFPPPPNFADFESFRQRPMSAQKPQKTIRDEINSLSPELKALILSGALDRKDFDD